MAVGSSVAGKAMAWNSTFSIKCISCMGDKVVEPHHFDSHNINGITTFYELPTAMAKIDRHKV